MASGAPASVWPNLIVDVDGLARYRAALKAAPAASRPLRSGK
jgi:hypothetical protein